MHEYFKLSRLATEMRIASFDDSVPLTDKERATLREAAGKLDRAALAVRQG